MFQKSTTTQRNPNRSRKPPAPTAPARLAVPGEVIEETKDILESVIPSSLVTTALSGAGKMVGEKAGYLTGQT